MRRIFGYTKIAKNGENGDSLLREMAAMMKGRELSAWHKHEGEDTHVFVGASKFDVDPAGPSFSENAEIICFVDGRIANAADFCDDEDASSIEVVATAFEKHGTDAFEKINGVFACAVVDTEADKLYFARDRFGAKPLYYTVTNDGNIVFASEIKCILAHPGYKKELNETALDNYLSFQYSFPEETFFKRIYSVPPACFITYQDGQVTTEKYCEVMLKPDDTADFDEFSVKLSSQLEKVVEQYKKSDKKVGSFLSSGVDSSYITSFFKDGISFTAGFGTDEKYNEIAPASELAEHFNIDHKTHIISDDEYWNSIGEVQYNMDQPLADPSCVSLFHAVKLASKYVDVALSGEGADEFFGGYRIYNEPFSLAGYQKLPRFLRKAFAKIVSVFPDFKGKSFVIRGSKTVEERFIGNANLFSKDEKKQILKNVKATNPAAHVAKFYDKVKNLDDTSKMQYIDIHCWAVGDIYLKADRSSNANSLEIRMPFLDNDVFEIASKMPTKFKIAKGTTKYLFRDIAKKRLPDASAMRPKLGFPVPIRVWLRDEKYYNIVRKEFLSDTAQKFFRTDVLMKYLNGHFKGKRDSSRKIWAVYIFLVWYKQYF